MKNIYIGHSSGFDYKKELYLPLQQSVLANEYNLIFPHDKNSEPYSSIGFFKDKCDLIIAEVSYPSTGLGIELGWANYLSVPIICIYKSGAKVSSALKSICQDFIEYSNSEDLIEKLKERLG